MEKVYDLKRQFSEIETNVIKSFLDDCNMVVQYSFLFHPIEKVSIEFGKHNERFGGIEITIALTDEKRFLQVDSIFEQMEDSTRIESPGKLVELLNEYKNE
jgi:hypothetical protein